MLAFDFLALPEKHPPQAVCVVYGDESFLRRQCLLALREQLLGEDEGDFSYSAWDGDKTELRDVLDELATVAMFGGGRRVVVVEEADGFVTRYRPALEDYVAKPSRTGILILELSSFPSNTKLYKAVAASGLLIDCAAPAEAKLTKWLVDWAKRRHQAVLTSAGADAILEAIGTELGLLDQELAKLAVSVGKGEKITPETISRFVGSWRTKTTWEMLDAALEGKVAAAMTQLDRLLTSGEQPIGILAQISASLRRLAAATRLILLAERTGKRISLNQALEQAGVKSFALRKAEAQLRRIGRQRGAKIYEWLLEADLDLKGDSALPARVILERLILRLAAPTENFAAQ